MKMDDMYTIPQPDAAVGGIENDARGLRVDMPTHSSLRAPLSLAEIEPLVREELGVERAAPVLSDTRRVLRELLMAERRIDEQAARALLLTEDLRGPLLRAVEFANVHARRMKRETGARRVRQADINRAGRVAKVIAIVAPESTPHRSRRPVAAVVPLDWKPVIDSVEGSSVTACAKRRHVELLVTAFARAGILTPAQLPTNADKLYALLIAEGLLTPDTICVGLSDLRSALGQCIATGTLPADSPVPGKRVGTRRLHGGAEWATNREAKLRMELPLWADDLEEYLAHAKDEVGGTPNVRRGAVFRVAVGLCGMRDGGLLPGVDLHTLQFHDLGTMQIVRCDSMTSRTISRAAARNGRSVSSDTVPLVEALGEYLTRELRERKPGHGVPPSVCKDIERVWGICTALLRPSPTDPLEDRVRWQGANEVVRTWAATAEESRPASECERNKGLLAEHLSLPQAIVFGIPYYTLVALPEAQTHVDAHAIGSVGRQTATDRLTLLLEEWVALATKVADPLRVEQRVFGRVGRELEITASFESASGVLTSVAGVTTHFAGKKLHATFWYGESNKRAGFKQHEKGPRSWDWPPSIVDLVWLARYFREVWYPRVQALGERRSMREAMSSGRWTLFPSTAAARANSYRWKGMCDTWISEKTGDAMLRVLREVLGHHHLPALRTDAIQAGWRSLLSDHNVRHLWATYWGGLRASRGPRQVRPDGTIVESVSGMEYCRRATTDEEDSLQEHYVALTQTIQRLLTRTVGSCAHPLSLDSIMDRASLTDRAVDWKAEWNALAAAEGIDAMPPALRARWLGLREPAPRRRRNHRKE